MSRTRTIVGGTETFRTKARQVQKQPPCQSQCPNSGDVRGWLGLIAQHEKLGISLDEAYDRAWQMVADVNPFPATTGRICPHPCEDRCSRGQKEGPVSINAMERFLGDWAISRNLALSRTGEARHVESIGVIGSGPASLSFAYQMARRGYGVTVYEKHAKPGGMLRYAIPDYRLPRDVLDAEVQRILDLGIAFRANTDIGCDVCLEDLREHHTLIFLGIGAQRAKDLGIPGEDGPSVVSGIHYLNQCKAHVDTGTANQVIVIGGGNTAIDAARSARRQGAHVTIAYRRSEAEMPAVADEIEDARREGVQFRFLVSPTRIIHDGETLREIEFQQMRLGEADEESRRRPEPVAGEFQMESADQVIVAVSQVADWHGMESLHNDHRWLHAHDDGKLGDDLWAGGDDRGPGIASRAIAQGRFAAVAAHAELRGEPVPAPEHDAIHPQAVLTDFFAEQLPLDRLRLADDSWRADPDAEVDRTISSDQACQEAARCMSCGLCSGCQQCFMYCNAHGFTRIEEARPGRYFALALDACEGCGKCIEVCPRGYLEART